MSMGVMARAGAGRRAGSKRDRTAKKEARKEASRKEEGLVRGRKAASETE